MAHIGQRVVDLRSQAKAAGIVGYSKMRKEELLRALANPDAFRVRKTPGRVHVGPKVVDLRRDAKAAGVKGSYKMNKSELLPPSVVRMSVVPLLARVLIPPTTVADKQIHNFTHFREVMHVSTIIPWSLSDNSQTILIMNIKLINS